MCLRLLHYPVAWVSFQISHWTPIPGKWGPWPIMHLTGFFYSSLRCLWFHFPDVLFLDAQTPADPVLHIFGANILSTSIMVLPLLTTTVRKIPKANKLKTSLHQIASIISLNAHVLWGACLIFFSETWAGGAMHSFCLLSLRKRLIFGWRGISLIKVLEKGVWQFSPEAKQLLKLWAVQKKGNWWKTFWCRL